MGTFKVVSTLEKQGIYFSVVPSQWEKDNILFWPDHLSHSKRESLRTNPHSQPETNWATYPCVVKCTGVALFKEALVLEKQISQCADTDAEETYEKKNRLRKAKNDNGADVTTLMTDRNNLFDNVTESFNSYVAEPIVNSPVEPEAQSENSVFQTIYLEPPVDVNQVTSNEIKNQIDDLQKEFAIFQLEMKDQYAKINVSLDKIFKLLQTSQQELPRKDIGNRENPDLLKLFPLSTCEQITELDTKIKNNEIFRTQLIEFLSRIGGTSGVEDGAKVAYKVVDVVFLSHVLINYTWTGVSRNKSVEKKPFQILDGILGVFFQVIALADNRHTQKKNCSIFKDGVLKHAKKKRTTRKRIKHNENETSANDEANEDDHMMTDEEPEGNI